MRWEKPQLILLQRGSPAESVLAVCKLSDRKGDAGSGSDGIHCAGKSNVGCTKCDSYSSS